MGVIARCLNCHTVFRAKLVTGDEYTSLYQNPALMETPFYLANKFAADSTAEPMPTFSRGLQQLGELLTPGRILDVGCSYGAFMMLAQESGWEAYGVELNSSAVQFAREQRHLNVYQGTIEQAAYPAEHFDAVTLWDVIEHFDSPVSTLREIHRVLAPGGVLSIFTINQESLLTTVGHALYKMSLSKWKSLMSLFYDIHHNFFFSPRSISYLLNDTGFEVREIQFAAANVRRWRTVPISEIMILGTDVIDFISKFVNRRYRMFVLARKVAR
jgi:2-polyprenyl-3-methyl-5-hydroxy-6-metoxy-1,4-benzoquinol methylase